MDSFPKVEVSLTLSGKFFDEVHCAKIIGIEPTNVFKQKNKALWSSPHLDQQCYNYEIRVIDCCDIDAAVGILLEKIWDHRDRIVQYAREFDLSIGIVVSVTIYNGDQSPVYDLERPTIARLAELEASYHLAIQDCRERKAQGPAIAGLDADY